MVTVGRGIVYGYCREGYRVWLLVGRGIVCGDCREGYRVWLL